MSDLEIIALSGLGVFALVMASLMYVMYRDDKDE